MNTVSAFASILRKVGLYRQVSILRSKWLAQRAGMSVSESNDVISITKNNRRIDINGKDPAYVYDMIRWFEYYHSAVKPIEAAGIAIVDYSKPRLHQLSATGVEFKFPGLPETDNSIQEYVAALEIHLGDAVFDLGAYAGASTYFLSKAVGPEGLVVALEPDDTTFRYLQENVARHNLKNVKCLNNGIWDVKGPVHFQMEGNLGSGVVTQLGRNSNSKMVSMITLQDAADVAGGRRIAAIKMDIEGSELPVLKAAREFLVRNQPNLIIEPHFIDGRFIADELCDLLRSYGFETKMLSQGTEDWPLISAKMQKRDTSIKNREVIGVPLGKPQTGTA